MPVDMKETIAKAAKYLIFKKQVRKLTVKDIVDECQITRQTFYYHFEDIPGLFRWILEQDEKQMLHEIASMDNPERILKYFFQLAINMTPEVHRGMQTNYREELQQLIYEYCYCFLEAGLKKTTYYSTHSQTDIRFFLRYHSYAILGFLQNWNTDDTEHIDEIVHQIYLLIKTEIEKNQ